MLNNNWGAALKQVRLYLRARKTREEDQRRLFNACVNCRTAASGERSPEMAL
jgi:hypothetical protein